MFNLMAIVKTISSRATTSSTEDEEGPIENEEECSSGGDSDSSNASDSLDGGEKGTELCSVGDESCSIPYELFDLLDLRPVLCLESWNYYLTEEERFSLSAYLPDMDQSTFVQTLKELLAGESFHFGSPLFELYDRLKGGLCQPEVARYRQGLEFLQRKEHYHFLRNYQNTMVNNLLEMRETWEHCRNLGIDEKLKIWKSWKHQKAFNTQEEAALPSLKGEYVQKVKSGRLSIHVNKTPKASKDEKMVELDPSLGLVKGLSMKLGGPYSSGGYVVPHKGSLELRTGVLGSEEIKTMEKQVPRGVLKISKNGQTEMRLESGHVASYSEMQDLEIKSKSKFSRWEVDDLVEATSITRGKTRSRTKVNRLETDFEKVQGHQSCDYLNKNAGMVKSGVHHHRKFGRLKEQHISHSVYEQMVPKIGQFWNVNNHSGGNRTLEDFKKRGQISAEHVRGDTQEMSRGKLHTISSNDLRKYSRDRDICAEDQEQSSGKKKRISIDFHRNPTNQWQEPIDLDTKQAFEQEMILNDTKPDHKEAEIHERKKGKTDYLKTSDQLKKNNIEINHLSKDLFVFSAKQNISSAEHKLEHQAKFLEGHSELVETSRYASHISLSPDNLKKPHEGKKKKRKKRQIDDVMTFDLEKKHEESSSDCFKEGTETPKGFQVTEQYEDIMKFGKTNTKNMKNGSLTRFCHQSSEAAVPWKKTKTNAESDVDVLDRGVSNGSYVNAQSTLGKQAHNIKPLKKTNKKTLKKDADILAGSTELDTLPNNPWFRSCQQIGVLKPGKKGAKKKLEDSKIVDGIVESNGITDNQCTLSLDSNEFKAVNRKAKKVKAESEIFNGVPELKTLECNESPSLSQQVDEEKAEKKQTRKKMEDTTGSLSSLQSKQASITDKVTPDAKASKKPSPLVMPSVVSSFSFSVIHFLSAVRTAMLSPSAEDISEVVNHYEKSDGERESSNQEGQLAVSCQGKVEEQNSVFPNQPLEGQSDACRGGSFSSNAECERQATSYSIPFQEIVKQVETNPGDPCVLKIQEPLQDLVRGALKIFSSKTAPQGVKGWKPLAVYDKSTRCWSWIGPVSSRSPRHQVPEVQTSESWGISQKMLLKLVEAFANWLKNGQETLQQIVLLPSPPPPLMSKCMDEKERFRDLRAQKSSITIAPSSPDMRAYFRREEVLRYSVPDRAFAYTAADGRKAVVAPLRRCGGKPTSKARDHFILKSDRPPHVTILCLVRDAAARLPGSIGTRADVCTLIRDSQYIVEDVSDAQINQVVSGALDRLHYERDPCVQFDGERKLWVYLHAERDEEDFEDDGTSSTKRWKRPKKENGDNPDPALCNDIAYHSVDEQDACRSGLAFDFYRSDYNGDSSSIYSCGKTELLYNRNGSLTSPRVLRIFNESNVDDGMVPFIELPPSIHSIPGSMHESHLMGWEVLGQNPLGHGLNVQSQEPTSNGDLDNGTFSRETN